MSADDPLRPGIVEFYSAETDVVLAQFNHINHLLGKTHDWLHPGAHCEILLRDFIRRNMLSWMRVDKGYIYGRTMRGTEDRHCPEIDILVHNVHDYRPIFRLEDFVIVDADAALAMIQVKRTLNFTKCRKGIANVAEAKSHIVKAMASRRRGHVSLSEVHYLFSAVVGYEDNLGDAANVKESLVELLTNARRLYPTPPVTPGNPMITMMPQFIGSLTGHFAIVDSSMGHERLRYYIYKSVHGDEAKGEPKTNVALQALLSLLSNSVFHFGTAKPPFRFPPDMKYIDGFDIEPPPAQ
jgi:hypothetical protein